MRSVLKCKALINIDCSICYLGVFEKRGLNFLGYMGLKKDFPLVSRKLPSCCCFPRNRTGVEKAETFA